MTYQIRAEEPGDVRERVDAVDPLHLIQLLLSCLYQTVLERGLPGVQLQNLNDSNMHQISLCEDNKKVMFMNND